MKTSVTKVVIALITIGASAGLGAWIKTVQDEKAHRMRYLDFAYEFRSVIGFPGGPEKNIEVFWKEQKINNLTQVNVSLYNPTDRDYADLPVYIEIYSTTGDSLALLDAQITGTEDSPNFILPIRDSIPSRYHGSLKFGYKIKAVNRVGNKPVFAASYLVIGKPDKFQINVVKDGLDIVDYNYEHFYKRPLWDEPVFIITCGAVIILLVLLIGFQYAQKQGKEIKKYNKKLKKKIKDELTLKISQNELPLNPDHIAETVIKVKEKYGWESSSRFDRWLYKIEPPDEEQKD